MTYESQAALRSDMQFNTRLNSSLDEQAMIFRNDGRPDMAALAVDVLNGDTATIQVWIRVTATSPGFADKPPGEITDGEILSSVQANWPTVAEITHPQEVMP